MKAFAFILLSSLVFFHSPFFSHSLFVDNKTKTTDSGKKIKRPVNIHLLRIGSVTRSLPPMITGYIEADKLYINFDVPINGELMQVVDADSGEIIYSAVFSGATLVIPLTVAGSNYVVEIL